MSHKKKQHKCRNKEISYDDTIKDEYKHQNRKSESHYKKDKYNSHEDETKDDIDEENNTTISEDDLKLLGLLFIEYKGIMIELFSEVLFLNSNIQGINFLYGKYNNESDFENTQTELTPDLLGLYSIYGFAISKCIYTYVSFARYNSVLNKYKKGEFKYSLQPNIDINIGNILGLLSYVYLIRGAEGIVKRDNGQPLFGI